MTTPHIAIGLPSYGGSMKNQTVQSLLALQASFIKAGWRFPHFMLDISDPVLCRNVMASMALRDETLTHLLMIDSDMKYRPEAIFKMKEHQKPLIGCVYPQRGPINYDRLAQLGNASDAMSRSLEFNIQFADEKPLQIVNGAAKVAAVGMGITLIERRVLIEMQPTVETYKRHGLKGFDHPVFGFFDKIKHGDMGLTEDYSFCLRWRRLGGEVWALVDEQIGHVGELCYEGKYADKILAGER